MHIGVVKEIKADESRVALAEAFVMETVPVMEALEAKSFQIQLGLPTFDLPLTEARRARSKGSGVFYGFFGPPKKTP
jgi:hypothetical protein